jgi:hypothetical protein
MEQVRQDPPRVQAPLRDVGQHLGDLDELVNERLAV